MRSDKEECIHQRKLIKKMNKKQKEEMREMTIRELNAINSMNKDRMSTEEYFELMRAMNRRLGEKSESFFKK